jgi:hypothetical protein
MDTIKIQPTNKKLSENDPLKTLCGMVIGTSTIDGIITRGRLIKCDDRELWLEKFNEDVVMIARAAITNIWVSRDCTNPCTNQGRLQPIDAKVGV